MTSTAETEQPPTLATLAEKGWRSLETLHVVGYFAPEMVAALKETGLRGRHGYFASRSAPMGAVSPGVAEATFYVFSPALVRAALPEAWTIASPEQVVAARFAGIGAALRTALGEAWDEEAAREATELATVVTDGLDPVGRALYAGHADLDVPGDPLLALWHAATLLREHRGDTHVALLVGADVGPVEALELEAAYRPAKAVFLRSSRGWTEEETDAARRRLADRGWVTGEGEAIELTDAGRAARDDLEQRTGGLELPAWEALGVEGAGRLVELVRPLARAVVASGVLPGTLGRR